jgi:hypothetical protein
MYHKYIVSMTNKITFSQGKMEFIEKINTSERLHFLCFFNYIYNANFQSELTCTQCSIYIYTYDRFKKACLVTSIGNVDIVNWPDKVMNCTFSNINQAFI